MATVLWFIGLLGLVAATLVVSARARAAPAEVVSRGVVGVAAVAYVAIVVAAVWVWGGTTATEGRATQLREGALVHLAVDGVRVALTAPIAIGHARDAAMRVPGDGDEVARVEPAANGDAVVRGAVLAVVHGDPATSAALRGCAPSEATYALPAGAAVTAIECVDGRPVRAFVVRHARRGELTIAPLAWRGRFVAEQLTARVGDALRLGGGEDVIAGLTTWDVVAPRGTSAMLAIPADPTECDAWLPDRAPAPAAGAASAGAASSAAASSAASGAGSPRAASGAGSAGAASGAGSPGTASGAGSAGAASVAGAAGTASGAGTPGAASGAGAPGAGSVAGAPGAASGASVSGMARAKDGACVVEVGAFVVTATPLLPDAEGVIGRGARAAGIVGGPALLLLVALGLAARRDRRIRGLARALRLGVLGAALAALCGWRLLWAYRIDMLRELASVGPRLVENQLAVIGIGAALAGNAVLAHEALATASHARRALAAALGWLGWLAVGALVLGLPELTVARAGGLAISLGVALAPVACVVASRLAASLAPELGLAAIAAGALLGKAIAPRSALVKLALAYAFVLAAHAALRRVLVRETSVLGRIACVGLLAAGALALARYDAGVTLAIVGLGLTFAMLVAGHDTAYDASQAARIGVLEREHARLLAVHGAAGIAIAVGVAAAALSATDHALITEGAAFVVHAPLAIAALFALAAVIARSHRRGWAPWLCAAAAALALWGARAAMVERATGGETVGARRVASVLDPGYAVLRDERAFVANASAWREASLPGGDRWAGEGYFGARVRDPGVARSIDNDYLPVLVARETGIAGLTQTIALLLALAIGGGAIASVRLRHASRQHRARWLITAVAGGLAVYQPLASLGVLPLTGISWPGLGIDSPADIWLFVLGAVWCLMCGDDIADDERVRRTARLRRARAVVLGALGVAALAAVVVVARAGRSALGRVASEDARVDAALAYAATIACPWPAHDGATLDELVPAQLASAPRDEATARFDRELRLGWAHDRVLLLAALPACTGRAGRWTLARDGEACAATWRAGMPIVRLRSERADGALHGTCGVALADERIAGLRAPARAGRAPRIRVVSEAIGAAAADAGELIAGSRVVRLRPGAPAVELAASAPGVTPASRVGVAGDVVLEVRATPRGVVLRGDAELFVSEIGPPAAWRRMTHGPEVLLDRVTLIAAGPPAQRRVALFRPPRAWPGGAAVVDSLLADDTSGVGDRARRTYPYGAALPELGWVNPYDVDRSLGLDGWIHAALRQPAAASGASAMGGGVASAPGSGGGSAAGSGGGSAAGSGGGSAAGSGDRSVAGSGGGSVLGVGGGSASGSGGGSVLGVGGGSASGSGGASAMGTGGASAMGAGGASAAGANVSGGSDAVAAACGTLAPPAIERERVCSPSPLDGVMECRVALQPELAATLRAIAEQVIAAPKAHTGRDVTPVRVAYVALRGDTGELLAQGNVVPGRGALAYAPIDAAAEAQLIALREARGEADGERVEWNLPIAVGSTFKPILARAAEQAFPQALADLALTADGHATGCKAHHGVAVEPMLGHCPPSTLADAPSSSDLHDYLARSLNWYQAALGVLGLGLPAGEFRVGGAPVTLADIAASDLASWPTTAPLEVADGAGAIVDGHNLVIAGLRRTPLWARVEALLGRPLCTLGDRARCDAAAERADVCAARSLAIASPGRDLRYLVALGPDQVNLYGDARAAQARVPIREYFQLLRGSGVHAIGSLAQLTDAFGRVVYDPSSGPARLAASWFPAPAVGVTPAWSCAASEGHANTVLGADGGLCAVVQAAGTAHAHLADLLRDPKIVVYGAKTGTIDSLADIARKPSACAAWNARHVPAARLACGKPTPDDSLFVIAFGVVTARGTVPITLGVQLQRGAKGSAAHVTPELIHAIADYLQ